MTPETSSKIAIFDKVLRVIFGSDIFKSHNGLFPAILGLSPAKYGLQYKITEQALDNGTMSLT